MTKWALSILHMLKLSLILNKMFQTDFRAFQAKTHYTCNIKSGFQGTVIIFWPKIFFWIWPGIDLSTKKWLILLIMSHKNTKNDSSMTLIGLKNLRKICYSRITAILFEQQKKLLISFYGRPEWLDYLVCAVTATKSEIVESWAWSSCFRTRGNCVYFT